MVLVTDDGVLRQRVMADADVVDDEEAAAAADAADAAPATAARHRTVLIGVALAAHARVDAATGAGEDLAEGRPKVAVESGVDDPAQVRRKNNNLMLFDNSEA